MGNNTDGVEWIGFPYIRMKRMQQGLSNTNLMAVRLKWVKSIEPAQQMQDSRLNDYRAILSRKSDIE